MVLGGRVMSSEGQIVDTTRCIRDSASAFEGFGQIPDMDFRDDCQDG